MQTFLPFISFERSLACLDKKRLGKQRLEARWILDGKQPNHPAARMWMHHRPLLAVYYNLSLAAWAQQGGNNLKLQFERYHQPTWAAYLYFLASRNRTPLLPWWLGHVKLRLNHRGRLLQKDEAHYAPHFGNGVKPVLMRLYPDPDVEGKFIAYEGGG